MPEIGPFGNYIIQNTLHSLVALYLTEMAMIVWVIRSPAHRFRYRLLALTLPTFFYPLFQSITPDRGLFYFRFDQAWFDSTHWLSITAFSHPIFYWLCLGMGIATILIAFWQEFIPLFRTTSENSLTPITDPALTQSIGTISTTMHIPLPIITQSSSDHIASVRGLLTHTIILPNRKPDDLMKAIVAHELAHVRRKSNLRMCIIYFIRLFSLFNPIAIILFRRLALEEEKACDDIAAQTLGPSYLETIQTLYHNDQRLFSTASPWEVMAHLHWTDRLQSLKRPPDAVDHFQLRPFVMTISVIMIFCYFIV